MKNLLILFIGVSLIACNDSGQGDIDLVNAFADAPPGAERIPYPDKEGLVKVVKENDGRIMMEGDYLNGLRHGTWTEYHPTGMVKNIRGYFKGQMQGVYLSIDHRGNLLEKATFGNGKKNGPYYKFERGRIVQEMSYVNDLVDGAVRRYYPNGGIQEQSYYSNGILHGTAQWFDQEGNVTIQYKYENGKLVDKGEDKPAEEEDNSEE